MTITKLLNDDCLKKLKEIKSESVDLIFADPPYNLQLKNQLSRPDSSKVEAVNDYWDQFNSFKDYDDFTIKWIKECKRIHLIKEDKEISKYYYHTIGHFLGLDVHDVGHYNEPLQEGMVLTIEPGLYIEEEGIGVRIEDNILITKDGCINLSEDIIKEVDDIERFMR